MFRKAFEVCQSNPIPIIYKDVGWDCFLCHWIRINIKTEVGEVGGTNFSAWQIYSQEKMY